MNVTPNLAFATARIGRVGALIVISGGLLALAAAAQTAKDVRGNSGVCTPMTANPCWYFCAHARTYGSVRNQLMQV